jgi:excisionase family DNA binding protein
MGITNLTTHTASYVTVAELAEYWDVTRQLVYKHIRSGQLPAIRLGPRCFRIPTKEVLAFEQLASSKWWKSGRANRGGKSGGAPIVPLRNRAGQSGGQSSDQRAGQVAED